MKRLISFFAIFSLLTIALSVIGQNITMPIQLPETFNNHMVLQRNRALKIWGTAPANTSLNLKFNNQDKKTVTDTAGNWQITLDPMKAGGPYKLEITAGLESLTFNDILIGDVFLAGGQSNMAYNVAWLKAEDREELYAKASNQDIRYYNVARIVSSGKLLNEKDKPWAVCQGTRINDWSAVALYFAFKLMKEINVPIGIIGCNHGGSPAEAWIGPEAYHNDPELVESRQPQHADTHYKSYYRNASTLYNAMLKKVLGYEIAGVIWYQGEDNAMKPDAYEKVFSGLIADWRKKWNNDRLPFVFAQLPAYTAQDPTNEAWVKVRDAQFKVWQKTPGTGMVSTIDVGDLADIHPKNKKPVGERLAISMSHLLYGSKAEYSGPIFKSLKLKKNQTIISFSHSQKLVVRGSELTGFEICGTDKVYKPAKAVIKSGKIKVWSDEISTPISVRYAWKNDPVNPNLSNQDGLPAVPFNVMIK